MVNVGTTPGFRLCLAVQAGRSGLARCPPTAPERGGGPVVVRAGESPCTRRRGPAGSRMRGTARDGDAGEHWRVVARPSRGAGAGTADAGQAALLGGRGIPAPGSTTGPPPPPPRP